MKSPNQVMREQSAGIEYVAGVKDLHVDEVKLIFIMGGKGYKWMLTSTGDALLFSREGVIISEMEKADALIPLNVLAQKHGVEVLFRVINGGSWFCVGRFPREEAKE